MLEAPSSFKRFMRAQEEIKKRQMRQEIKKRRENGLNVDDLVVEDENEGDGKRMERKNKEQTTITGTKIRRRRNRRKKTTKRNTKAFTTKISRMRENTRAFRMM